MNHAVRIGAFVTAVVLVNAAAVRSYGQESEPTEKRAFLVGVAKYQKDGLPDLAYSEKDMRVLAEELKKQGFKVELLLGPDATRARTSKLLDEFVESLDELKKTDVAIIGFSGHGLQRQIQNEGRLEEDAFFCPVDAFKEDPKSMISIGQLMDRVQKHSGSSQNLLVVDACRNNPAKGAKGIDGGTARNLGNKISVLYSSTDGMRSFESAKVQHGLFTYILLEGLRGEAATKNGHVTWLNLASYVMDTVPARAADLLDDPQAEQRPNLIGNLVRQPVLAKLETKVSREQPEPPGAPLPRNDVEVNLIPGSFISNKGNFAVLFPGEPRLMETPVANVPGGKVFQFMYESPDNKFLYMVAYNPISNAALSAEQQKNVLDAAPSGMLNAFKLELVSEKRQKIGAFTGREIKGESRQNAPKTLMTAYYAVAGGRLFQIVAVHFDQPDFEAAHAQGAKKFLESFQFLKDFEALPESQRVAEASTEGKGYRSEEGNFKADFPMPPVASTIDVPVAGGKIQMHQFLAAAPDESFSFVVAYNDASAVSADQFVSVIEKSQAGVLNSLGAEETGHSRATLGSVTGREIHGESKEGAAKKFVFTARHVIAGGRLYQVIVHHTDQPDLEIVHAKAARDFFTSFAFLKPPATANAKAGRSAVPSRSGRKSPGSRGAPPN